MNKRHFIVLAGLLLCCTGIAKAQQLSYMNFDRWSKTGGTWYP